MGHVRHDTVPHRRRDRPIADRELEQCAATLAYPEPIQEADVVIIVGGFDGTQFAASWARLASKPILPVAAFGGAAAEVFDDEISDFERRYGGRLPLDEYQILNRLLGAEPSADVVSAYAAEVVSLSERLIRSTDVFVIISFSDEGHLIDAYETFQRVCEKRGFNAYKVNDHLDAQQRILPNIVEGIRRSAFIIADLTELKPNVLWELGYAQALSKDVITTAREEQPFLSTSSTYRRSSGIHSIR